MKCSVYRIRNRTDGKLYVGFTSQSPDKRWYQHQVTARTGAENYLYRAMRKYGPAEFDFQVLVTGMDSAQALALESDLIAALSTAAPNGYNMTSGGEHSVPGPEARAKMSKVHKGKTLSPKHRALTSARFLGVAQSDSHRDSRIAASTRTRRAKFSAVKAEVLRLRAEGLSGREVSRRTGISHSCVCRWIREAASEVSQ